MKKTILITMMILGAFLAQSQSICSVWSNDTIIYPTLTDSLVGVKLYKSDLTGADITTYNDFLNMVKTKIVDDFVYFQIQDNNKCSLSAKRILINHIKVYYSDLTSEEKTLYDNFITLMINLTT